MYLADFHSHTDISPDSTAPIATMVAGAISKGLSALCITDHCDLLNEHGVKAAPWDWTLSLSQFQQVYSQYQGEIQLSLGIELGMSHLFPQDAATICALPELDFVLGSVHNMSPSNGGQDFFFMDFPDEETCYRALDDYFHSLESLSKGDYYDVLAHVIYPLRYMVSGISLERYQGQIRRIFQAVIAKGKGIEFNTYRGNSLEEWRPILELYRDCGGTIVTLGADAHAPNALGAGLPQAYEILRQVGFTHLTIYEKRIPTLIPLG